MFSSFVIKQLQIRQRIDGELEQLRSIVRRILSEQQQEFAQAFGLLLQTEKSRILVRIHSGELPQITLHIAVTTFFPFLPSAGDSFSSSTYQTSISSFGKI